jgi:(2S)-methylsuccinyl-CoA dehydrogenase
MTAIAAPDLPAAADAIDLADRLVGRAVRQLAASGGPDVHQVLAYDIAHAASGVATARSLLDYGAKGDVEAKITCAFAADMLHDLASKVLGREDDWGVERDPLANAHAFITRFRAPEFLAALADTPGPGTSTPTSRWCRTPSVVSPTEKIAPVAEHIHRHNADIPEDLIQGLAEMGGFGLSVPVEYDGFSEGGESEYIGMVVATEELSKASLGAGGSLITRPEILTRALLAGGTEAQKAEWLPKLASAEVMAAVAVTEPDYGSDVAGVKCTATPTDGGWLLNGVKTWCTFGARADVLMFLARTDPDRSKTHRGLSMFVVPKPRGEGHGFEFTQDAGADGGAPGVEGRWRVGPSTPSATAACTPTRSPSRTGSWPPSTRWAATTDSARASTTRWPGSRTADSRPPLGPSA